MSSFSNLVGSFMQNAMSQSGSSRLNSALGQLQGAAGSGGGGLGGMLGQLAGGLRSATGNPLQAGGIGAVTGALLGGRGGAVGGGALGLLASVAMQALQGAGQQGAAGAGAAPAAPTDRSPLGLREPEGPEEEAAMEGQAQLVLKGMINAAKADGQISPAEMQRILGKLEEAGADAEMQQWVMTQMAAPLELPAFIAEIPNAEVAAEVYAASLLAVEVDTDAERDYLRQLAEGAGLHPLVVNQLHETLGVPA
jgi:uncharacterized membrane protein YebE (DUF533 family)